MGALSIRKTRALFGHRGAAPFLITETRSFTITNSSHSNASFATATSGLRMNAGQRLSMNSPFNDIGIERRSQAARPVTTQSASFTENRAPMYSQQATSRPSHQVSGSSAYGSRQPYTRPTTMTSAQNPYPSQRASGHPMMRPGTAQESVRSAGQSTSRGVPSRPSYSLNSNRRRPSTSATRQPSPQVSRPGLYQSENRFSRFT